MTNFDLLKIFSSGRGVSDLSQLLTLYPCSLLQQSFLVVEDERVDFRRIYETNGSGRNGVW